MAEFIKFTQVTEGTQKQTRYLRFINVVHIASATYNEENGELILHVANDNQTCRIKDDAEVKAALEILRSR